MNLVRSSAYTGVATLAKLLAALVVIKLVAVFAGPQGVGRLGQFLALMSVLAVLAGGASVPASSSMWRSTAAMHLHCNDC